MAFAGHRTTVKVHGTAVAMTDEACTENSGTEFQISNAAKQVLNPAASVVVESGGTPLVYGTDYTLDYLFGRVLMLADRTGETITVTGQYLPLIDVAEARECEFKRSKSLPESTVFGDAARKRTPALEDLSGSLNTLASLDQEYESGNSLYDALQDGTAKLLEYGSDDFPDGPMLRAWVLFESGNEASKYDGLRESGLSFQGNPPTATNGQKVNSRWGTTSA
jgi:hypothetical protein